MKVPMGLWFELLTLSSKYLNKTNLQILTYTGFHIYVRLVPKCSLQTVSNDSHIRMCDNEGWRLKFKIYDRRFMCLLDFSNHICSLLFHLVTLSLRYSPNIRRCSISDKTHFSRLFSVFSNWILSKNDYTKSRGYKMYWKPSFGFNNLKEAVPETYSRPAFDFYQISKIECEFILWPQLFQLVRPGPAIIWL